jgi:protein-S-isoprenylcysteine O-methyltransferase Ste14
MRPFKSELYQGARAGRDGRAGEVGWKAMLQRLGGWLFRHRTWLPVPVVLALILFPPTEASGVFLWVGVAMTAAGELLRLLAVREIGVISRTRSDRLGPLVATGPFAITRNPLYIGNMAIWLGFTIAARVIWLIVPVAALLIIEYEAIVRWEEQLLEARFGGSYRAYAARVPRWLPRSLSTPDLKVGPRSGASRYGWRETLFSERGTLIAIAAGYVLLYLKQSM